YFAACRNPVRQGRDRLRQHPLRALLRLLAWPRESRTLSSQRRVQKRESLHQVSLQPCALSSFAAWRLGENRFMQRREGVKLLKISFLLLHLSFNQRRHQPFNAAAKLKHFLHQTRTDIRIC